jgi:hypothetical protein
VALLLIGCLLVASGCASTSSADSGKTDRSAGAEFGLGAGAFICTIPWGILKILYAAGGAVTGSLAFALTGGRKDVARAIWQPSLRGDYVVTPDNLTGREPLSFVGRDPEEGPYPY